MKPAAIKVGHTYADGKGGVRRVLDAGPQYSGYPDQKNKDYVHFKVMRKHRGPLRLGDEYNCTRTYFARWAKEEVE